jgi:hypothetical protein
LGTIVRKFPARDLVEIFELREPELTPRFTIAQTRLRKKSR